MITLLRTHADDPDFISLVKDLDAYLAKVDGEDHVFYAQFNTLGLMKCAVVAYDDFMPVGCGALKDYASNTMEIKRMYTTPESRGLGIATQILAELEKWSLEFGCDKVILETGPKQADAIKLYKKNGYNEIPNYGQYVGIDNSVCFEKDLN